MGDRGFITSYKRGRNAKDARLGLYLHWHGAPEWVKAIVCYCDARGYRSIKDDEGYAWARMAQVACNLNTYTFGFREDSRMLVDGLSVGIFHARPDEMMCDNGTYFLDGWTIVGRKDVDEVSLEDLEACMLTIDERFPEDVRLGKEAIADYVYLGKKKERI